MIKDILVIIPARGGSKGVPGKNIKPLGGKPLINYTIDIARSLFSDEQICVSSDDSKIIETVESYGLKVPFTRPAELSTDTATSRDVILHALNFYKNKGISYKYTLLLQPTSPFRTIENLKTCLDTANNHPDFELVISVNETDVNPYYVLFEEDNQGLLQKSKPSNFTRRQDCPKVWQVNGAFYLFDNEAFIEKQSFRDMNKIKFEMDRINSVDIDTPLDWLYAELIHKEKLV